ncbi:MAG TPA: protein kinase [Terriglobales bacterium]
MGLTSGSRLGAYEIQSPLGAGGMGEVYRATDTKLGRDVALKVLPASMADDADRLGRFRREAKVLAQLDHPNIVTIYSVEECDGVHFLTMQLVEGEPLNRVIPQDGLAIERIVAIGSALAEALAAAHDKGIVHRDLKPANVMVSDEGRVKVLDFGLAKDVRGSTVNDATMTSASQTQIGVVMGTPAYMSPEQTSGRPLDHRTDIFSLGVVLHEMATGRHPFEGSSSAELVSSILRDDPAPVTDLRPELPNDLARIIRRCLEKDPRHRVQTARDVGNEFRDLARTTARGAARSSSRPARTVVTPSPESTAADEGFWIAVLPFKYTGSSEDLKALAEGLCEEITTGLSRFSYLRVIARGSSAKYSGESGDIRAIGKELGARYVMEASLRQAGSKLRLAVQLVEATTGSHLWAENYERAFSPDAVFELQDDLVPRIVSTVADMNGVLTRSMSEGLRSRTPEELTPYEAVLRSFAYCARETPEELAAGRSGLEAAVRKAPAYADAWAMLSFLCGQDYLHGFGLQADALETAAVAAKKAVQLGPSNHLAYFSLAQSLSYQRDYDSFRHAAERAVTLNPMDGNSVAFLGELLIYAGNAERGMQLAERAKQLNPNHPGWYWYADFYHAYSQSDYRRAQGFALKAKFLGNPYAPMFVAAACGQLGDVESATQAAAELLKFRPELPGSVRKLAERAWNAEYGEQFIAGLRKAGMEIPEAGANAATSVAQPARAGSGEARADEGFWVAVLPFKYTGGDADLKALAEGLSEEVITGLSRFSYLRVIARGSTAKYSSESGDVRAIGKELGARYVMEGSLRQAGNKLRLAVQLVDATTGGHLWAENYERAYTQGAVFELQDDLVPRIVSTVADQHGILPRTISGELRNKKEEDLTPREAVLRSFSFMERISPGEHETARRILERAVEQDPNQSDAWAVLALLYDTEFADEFNARPNPLERAMAAAQRAVDLAPTHALGYYGLAFTYFLRKETASFRAAAERALALNPMDGSVMGLLGVCVHHAGEVERGTRMAETAIQLNPHHSPVFHSPAFVNAYMQGKYAEALDVVARMDMPGFFHAHALRAAALGQLGQRDAAQESLKELLALRPGFATSVRRDYEKWWDAKTVENLMDGLRKAGLEIPDANAPSALSSPAMSAVRTGSGSARADEGFWVAVLPFKNIGGSTDLEALGEGLTDDIVTNMSRFSYLRMIAGSSTARYAKQQVDIRTAAKELGARYVMEGSIRQAGAKIRISVQLVDAENGAGLWAETYDRAFSRDAILDLLDDVVPRIVGTVADTQGVLAHSMTDVLRNRDPETLTPYEAVLRSFGHYQRVNAAEHLAARTALELAVKRPPDRADCWANLALLYREEYTHGFNLQADPLGRALAASRRALDASPNNHLAQAALASTLFFLDDRPGFRAAAERAIVLNPLEGYTLAYLGMLIAYSGDWERGCALADRAMQLNPNHPGWYWFPRAFNAYRQRDYQGALEIVLKVNLPDFWRTQLLLAAAHGQLGNRAAAANAAQELLKIRPNFRELPRDELKKWHDEELKEHVLEGLRKAGLETSSPAAAPFLSSGAHVARTESGAARADEGFWVAVLPFKYSGSNEDLKALAEGLTEDIVTGLSRFSYLRVIARGSTSQYASGAVDVRTAGKELGARFAMEGTIRQAGSKLRIAVQLVDTVSGAHIWAENFERPFNPEGLFELQDELVPRIVSTVADAHGILPHTMSEAIRGKSPNQLTPYEAVLCSFRYSERISTEEHGIARDALERAVEVAPSYAYAWAMLSIVYSAEYGLGFNPKADPLGRGFEAARRAVELDSSGHRSHQALAIAHFYRKEFEAFRSAADRAIELNPMDGCNIANLGGLIAYAGEWQRGCALVEHAVRLNPNHPGWYWFPLFFDAYRKRDYQGALNYALKINLAKYPGNHTVLAAAYGQLDMLEEARKAVEELLKLNPKAGEFMRVGLRIHNGPEIVEHVIEGLRKAGMEIPEDGK